MDSYRHVPLNVLSVFQHQYQSGYFLVIAMAVNVYLKTQNHNIIIGGEGSFLEDLDDHVSFNYFLHVDFNLFHVCLLIT